MGLVLLAALQRRRRGIHISSMLRPEEVPLNLTLAELRAARNTSMDNTMNRLEVRGLGSCPGSMRMFRQCWLHSLTTHPCMGWARHRGSGLPSSVKPDLMGYGVSKKSANFRPPLA